MRRLMLALSAIAIPLPFAAMPVLAVTFMSGGGATDSTYVQVTSEPPGIILPLDALYIEPQEAEPEPVAMSLSDNESCELTDGVPLAGG